MTTIHSYTPKPDTFPAKVLEWFKANPDEELTREDVGKKWDMAPSQVSLGLNPCVKAGLLTYGHNEDLTMVYRLAKKGKATSIDEISKHFNVPLPESGGTSVVPTQDALEQLLVEHGVPVPTTRISRISKWQPVFDKLQARGDSVKVPAEWRLGLASYASKLNQLAKKQGTGRRYLVRAIDDKHARVWRIA